MMHLQHVGEKYMHVCMCLDGYDKATLTIVRGKSRDALCVFDILPTPPWNFT